MKKIIHLLGQSSPASNANPNNPNLGKWSYAQKKGRNSVFGINAANNSAGFTKQRSTKNHRPQSNPFAALADFPQDPPEPSVRRTGDQYQVHPRQRRANPITKLRSEA
ncbi:OLC1v1006032C1 [Oldenlandia corymbosa var. corymbosa]|uniref:OLC1v1006032C1 n=1 Tax=Oldenlandia corymbosa var. corymbosa TaxID=529605 RepID=A0AAV1DI49_OLDCO|nr:OLC1v1006032C1 [Oldenlandia corymbosa var. corymbosa]